MEKRSAIQHVFKVLFHLASLASLLLFAVTVVGWAWSNQRQLSFKWIDGTRDVEINASAVLGRIRFSRQTGLGPALIFPPGLFPPSAAQYVFEADQPPVLLDERLMDGNPPIFDHLGVLIWNGSIRPGGKKPVWGFKFPCWYPAALFALLPFCWYRWFRRRPNAMPGYGFDVEVTTRPGQL